MCHNRAVLRDVRLQLDGNLSELARLASEVARFCQANSFGAGIEFDVNLALEELFTNAVRHGGCEGMKGAAEVQLRAVPDAVEIEFGDRGRPFDPATASLPDLDRPLESRPIGGLGLHLVREIMRDLSYRRTGEWNRIRMRRPI